MKVFSAALLTVVLASCATSYKPPREAAPPLWNGPAGFQLAPGASYVVHEGTMHAGDALIELPVQYRRTGIIADEVRTKSPFGGDVIIPKGAKAFAMQYTLYRGTTYSPMRNAQGLNDPNEWCVFLPNGADGKKTEPETVCMFWEGADVARYIQYNTGAYAYSPAMYGASGMKGPVPNIVVQPVDFGVQLKQAWSIVKIQSNGFRVADGVASDSGFAWAGGSTFYKWGEERKVTLKRAGLVAIVTPDPAGALDAVKVQLLSRPGDGPPQPL